jgi:protein-L-isoaspartate(D-aspartate) O-methyltransferase
MQKAVFMDQYLKYQKQLLEASRSMFIEDPLSQATEKAFLETPRHLFVKRYRLEASAEWCEVNESNLEQHLPILYRNHALTLLGDTDDSIRSTISQPSLVLYMLDLLKLEPGQKVFELGAGSGWNAALMGHIVGLEGRVYSLEIIPEMVKTASEAIASLGIKNVEIIQGDGGGGYATGAPFDRAVFTAGSYDVPRHFYEQVKNGGLLLIVIKNEGGGDCLFLLRKAEDHFESITALPCGFISMTGRYSIDSLDPVALETLPEWAELKEREISRRPFWWGGKGLGFIWRTLSIRSFLSIIEPLFKTFKVSKTEKRGFDEHFFGLWDKENLSLVVAREDQLIAYGNSGAEERLMRQIHNWCDLGMPGAVSFKLKTYPIDAPLSAGDKQWIVRRRESQFLWSLEA